MPGLDGTDYEPEEEDAVGRESRPVPVRPGYVAHRTAEFDNQVPFYRIFTESAPVHTSEGNSDAGDGDVVPEGFVRAYTQELQSKDSKVVPAPKNPGPLAIDDKSSSSRTPVASEKDVESGGIVNGTKAELLAHVSKVLFLKNKNTDSIPNECEQSFRAVEGMLPTAGFAGGLNYPTALDMAVLNMVTSYEQWTSQQQGDPFSQYPKIKALAQRTAAARAAQDPAPGGSP
jgi:hypothetical protein